MKNLINRILIFFGFMKSPKKESITFPSYGNIHLAFDFMIELNLHRKNIGLKPLFTSGDKEIIDMCYHHAQYMQEQERPSHDGEFDRKQYIIQLFGDKTYCEECCAGNYSSSKAYLNSFLKSSKHKRALESKQVDTICAVLSSDEKYLIVFMYTKDIMKLRK